MGVTHWADDVTSHVNHVTSQDPTEHDAHVVSVGQQWPEALPRGSVWVMTCWS